MSDTVIAALIGALASVIVAIIGKQTSGGRNAAALERAPGRRGPTLPWTIVGVLLLVWLVVSPGLIHHDFAGTNFFAIPIVLLVVALVCPIRPLTATWVSLSIYSSNFVLGPLGNRLAGSRYDTQFGLPFEKLWLVLLIGFGVAAIIAGACALRLRYATPHANARADSAPLVAGRGAQGLDSSFAEALSRLADLHTAGKLTDQEFLDAKRRLLEQPKTDG